MPQQLSIADYLIRPKKTECSPHKRKCEENEETCENLVVKEPRKVEQAIIDAGQKNIGPIFCKECHFYFSPNVTEDCIAHEKHHKITCTPGLAACFKLNKRKSQMWQSKVAQVQICDDGVIYKVDQNCPTSILSQIDKVMETVSSHLGNMPFSSPICTPKRSIFVFVTSETTSKIGGIIMTELIKEAHVLLGGNYGSEDCVSAGLGINRVWVVPSMRRRGIAFRLIRAARCNMVYGQVFSPSEVAFSDPTQDGTKLASKFYGENQRILIYAVPL